MAHRRLTRSLGSAFVVVVFAALGTGSMLGASGCCPDDETCHTPDEWTTTGCSNFPAPSPHEPCPSLDAFRAACFADATDARVDGNRCCYHLHAACI